MGLIRHSGEPQQAVAAEPNDRAGDAQAVATDTRGAAALVDAWRNEPDARKREALIAAIAAARDAHTTDALLHIVETGDASSRNFAILAWQGLPVEHVLRGAALLESANPDARVLALSVLQAAPGRDIERLLIELVHDEADINVCAAAVELLAECGTRAASVALLAARERFADSEFVVFAIDHALRQTGAHDE